MVRRLLKALTRLAIVWIPAWTLICCGCLPAMEGTDPQWTAVRTVLWFAALASCVWEIRRMNRQFIVRTDALKGAGVPLPNRLDRTVGRPLTLILVGLLISVVLCTRWVVTPGFFNPIEWVNMLLLSITILTLMTGSWSALVYRWASRKLTVAQHPSSAPFLIAMCMTCVMVLLLIRSPRAGVVQLGSTMAMSTLMTASGTDPTAPIELLVELGPDDHLSELEDVLWRYGAHAERAVPSAHIAHAPSLAQTFKITAPGASAAVLIFELALDPENVVEVTVNELVPATAMGTGEACTPTGRPITNDPLSASQAPLTTIGASPLLQQSTWHATYQPAVQIHVLDDGISGLHEDLRGVVTRVSGGRGAHGTAVAGIAAARTHNAVGIASLNGIFAPFELVDHDVMDTTPSREDVAEALVIAGNSGADVALMAMVAPGDAPKLIREAAAYAQARGVVLVAAAGNNRGYAHQSWPANIPGVLVATAGDGNGRASFSAHGGSLRAVSAPGSAVCAPQADGGYARENGTSMSAAFVASAVAMYAARCPQTTSEQRIDAVLRTASPIRGTTSEPLLNVYALSTTPCY